MKIISASTKVTIICVVCIGSWAIAGWTPYTSTNSPLGTDSISGLSVNPAGKILIGTHGRGLAVKNGTNWQIFNSGNTGVPINYSFCTRYGDETLFIGSASGNLDYQPLGEGLSILNLSDSSWMEFNSGLGISPIITGIEITPSYRAVSTYGGGITLFNNDGWVRYQSDFRTVFTYADSQQHTFAVPHGTYIPTDYIKAIDYDEVNDILWIATLSGGAVAYSGGNWNSYNLANSGLPSNRIQVVKADPATGHVYFGTFGFGLAQKAGDQWSVYNTGNSPLLSNHIHSMQLRPDNGDLWVGTRNSLNILSRDGLWSAYVAPDSGLIWGNFYSGIAFDSSGNVWVSAFGGGIASMPLEIYIEPDPDYDSLYIDIHKLKIFLREFPLRNVIWLKAHLEPAVALEDLDTVAATISTDEGTVYRWQATFDQFQRIFHAGNNDIYLASVDNSLMSLWYQHNQNRIKLYLIDWEPDVNRDNLDFALNVGVQLGNYMGNSLVYVGEGDPSQDPDADTLDFQQGDLLLSTEYAPVIMAIDDNRMIPSSINVPFNYPNPFNPFTTIAFSTEYPAIIQLNVYDVLGRKVSGYEGYYDAGTHRLDWNGSGRPSGVYYYIIRYEDKLLQGRMTLLK